MTKSELAKLYRLARKLAFVYRPFYMDREDAVQEYVIAGLLAAEKCPTWCWKYLYRSMYNRFLCLIRKPQIEAVDIDDIPQQARQIIPIPLPQDEKLASMLVAIATYPTYGEAFSHLGMSYAEGYWLLGKAKKYVHEHMEQL